MDIEFEILEDGTILIDRQNKEYNDMVWKIFNDIIQDPEALKSFLDVTKDTELIFGPRTLCG